MWKRHVWHYWKLWDKILNLYLKKERKEYIWKESNQSEMKQLILGYFFILIPSLLFAQDYCDLSCLQGLKKANGDILFEVEGYNITVSTTKGSNLDDERILSTIKSKYKIENILTEYVDIDISKANWVIEAEQKDENKPEIKLSQICYLISTAKDEITAIYMQTFNERDIALEQTFVDTYQLYELSDYISNETITSKIWFAGQMVNLDQKYNISSPRNIESDNKDQITWSEFTSFEKAEKDINLQISINNNIGTIVDEKDIEVLLNNITSIAHRVAYAKLDAERKVEFRVIYYVVQEIRGRYVSCVFNYKGTGIDDYEAPPLISSLLSATKPLDEKPYEEEEETEEYPDNDERISFLDIQAGTFLPIGQLSNKFKVAPMIGLYLGLPLKKNLALDIGFQLAVPINKGQFDYHYKKETYSTKADFMGNINLRIRSQRNLSGNLFLIGYLGLGVNIIETDLEKDYYEDDEAKYCTLETANIFGGLNLRYKKFGAFVEYHHLPYSTSSKVNNGFGNSAVNLGLSLSFFTW